MTRGKDGVLKPEEFPCTGKLPQSWVQRGAVESWKTRQSRDLEGRKQRKLHFSACKELMDCGPDETAGLGN